mmetsp:Transcript_28292/g.92352  ORF Transcript_28292/g.92352 Transcript_28292/m.92352 type:complete len:247 (+) Transcript_28292:154-894(+)
MCAAGTLLSHASKFFSAESSSPPTGGPEMSMRRCWQYAATHKNTEHIPNMAAIGNADTLYRMQHTKRLSGMRKTLMMVARTSSGTYCERIFMMDGQKMPTVPSNTQNPTRRICPTNEMPPSAPGTSMNRNQSSQIGSESDAAAMPNTTRIYSSTLRVALLRRRFAMDEPIMDESINVAKMNPCGMTSSLGLSAGVHRNTKLYIDASKRACIAPRRAIFWSEAIMRTAVWNCCASEPVPPSLPPLSP